MAGTMVSRRKILSRSRDNLNVEHDEEDVWHQKDKLFREHIQEVLDKWTQIDDEIWAKIIVFERNRRVAKAYARVPVLTINGSDDGFDGMRIGLCGFDNPLRDAKTAELKNQINQGVKVKMDDAGNILVRRYAKSNVFIKSTSSSAEESAIGSDVMKMPNQSLEIEKVYKIFDMKKFQSNVNRELSRAYPDRRRLETQCLSIISFVKTEHDLLECPIWVMIVNVVAMDMLKSKIPPVHRPIDIKNRPKIPIPDEDPYSEAIGSASSSNSSGLPGEATEGGQMLAKSSGPLSNVKRIDKPPKLPPRDSSYSHVTKYGLSDFGLGKSDKGKDSKKYDDPYYCGMRARVPNFAKQGLKPMKDKKGIFSSKFDKKAKETDRDRDVQESSALKQQRRPSVAQMPHPASFSTLYQLHQMQNGTFDANSKKSNFQRHNSHPEHFNMWQAKSYESGINSELESPYSVYGRLGTPKYGEAYAATRGYALGNIPRPTNRVYVGEWE